MALGGAQRFRTIMRHLMARRRALLAALLLVNGTLLLWIAVRGGGGGSTGRGHYNGRVRSLDYPSVDVSGQSLNEAQQAIAAAVRRRHARHAPYYRQYSNTSHEYHIVLVADMDRMSQVDAKTWKSLLKTATLQRSSSGEYSVRWTGQIPLFSEFSAGGRGMELSELCYFDGALLTFSDRTGFVFEVDNNRLIPRHILVDGNGHESNGFKAEWATVKDDILYVGSTGKPWTDGKGVSRNRNRQWVKLIHSSGSADGGAPEGGGQGVFIEHKDWGHVYDRIQEELQLPPEGYVLHEAVNWDPLTRRWYFLPRRISAEPFNEVQEQSMGNNVLISCDETFQDWRTTSIGTYHEGHGFSSFKLVPWRENEAVALKTEEKGDKTHTDLVVFTLDGRILMDEEFIDRVKFEGLEFT